MFATPISMKLNDDTMALNVASGDIGRHEKLSQSFGYVSTPTCLLVTAAVAGFFLLEEQASFRALSSTLTPELQHQLQGASDSRLSKIATSLRHRLRNRCVADISPPTASVEQPADLLEADIANKIESRQASGSQSLVQGRLWFRKRDEMKSTVATHIPVERV